MCIKDKQLILFVFFIIQLDFMRSICVFPGDLHDPHQPSSHIQEAGALVR